MVPCKAWTHSVKMNVSLILGALLMVVNAWNLPSFNHLTYLDDASQNQTRMEQIRITSIVWLTYAASADAFHGNTSDGQSLYACLLQAVLNYTRFESRLAEQGSSVQFRLSDKTCSAHLTAKEQGCLQFSCLYNIEPSCTSRQTNGSIEFNLICKVVDDIHI